MTERKSRARAHQETDHIFWVHFKNGVPGGQTDKKDFFFGGLSAIYDQFTSGQVGCKVENLWNVGIGDNKPYENAICVIRREPFFRKAQKRPLSTTKIDG